ncbi:MAG: hypothetical protein CMH26_04150 [Micavibrio sp.]|nr:hypothetical protein [Micavibrio sp.]
MAEDRQMEGAVKETDPSVKSNTADPKGKAEDSRAKAVVESIDKKDQGKSIGEIAERAETVGGHTALLKKSIEIFSNKPLPEYDHGPNKAYVANSSNKDLGGGSALVAIVCEPYLIPRTGALIKYTAFVNPNIAELVEYGVVFWPPAQQERYVFVYKNTWQKPLLAKGEMQAMGLKPEMVMEHILKPLITVMRDFKDRDFTHGAIRPSNMFGILRGDDGSIKVDKIVLGDSLSMPGSFCQPALYEPIERAMTDPIARGLGTQSDDLYSLGVSLAIMMRMNDPLNGLSDEEVIRKKIEVGTYSAITGKDRFKGDILELLRGILHDDPSQRWTIDEVGVWLDGRRLSPKQGLVRKKAPRPFTFLNGRYFILPVLSMQLKNSPSEVRRIVEDDSLFQWLERSVDDEEALERVEKAVNDLKDRGGSAGPTYQDRLVANISSALDTSAPLRYKGLSVMGHGLGTAIAEAMVLKKDLAPYIEILDNNLLASWLGFHSNPNVDITGLFSKSELARRMIGNKRMGEGIERCLYLLSPEAPCLSELLKAYFVTDGEELLYAFEDLSSKGKMASMYIDRHVAAFLMQKEAKVIDGCLYDLNSGEAPRVILSNLRVMAALQKRHNIAALPGMGGVFAGVARSVCEGFNDRETRDRLEKELKVFADKGDLVKMSELLDDPALTHKDNKAYDAAKNEYKALVEEAELVEERLLDKEAFGQEMGRNWAAIGSTLLLTFIIVAVALSGIFGGTVR